MLNKKVNWWEIWIVLLLSYLEEMSSKTCMPQFCSARACLDWPGELLQILGPTHPLGEPGCRLDDRRFVCLRIMSKATFIISSLIIWQTSDFTLLQVYQYFETWGHMNLPITMHEESSLSQGQYLADSRTACYCHWEEMKNRYPQKQPLTGADQCHARKLVSTFWILPLNICNFSLKLSLF